jgi:hypothetical protein
LSKTENSAVDINNLGEKKCTLYAKNFWQGQESIVTFEFAMFAVQAMKLNHPVAHVEDSA